MDYSDGKDYPTNDDRQEVLSGIERSLLHIVVQECELLRVPFVFKNSLRMHKAERRYSRDDAKSRSIDVERAFIGLQERGLIRQVDQKTAEQIVNDRVQVFGASQISAKVLEEYAIISEEAVRLLHQDETGQVDWGRPSVEVRAGVQVFWFPSRFTLDDLPLEYRNLTGLSPGGEPLGVVTEVGPWISGDAFFPKGWRFIAPHRPEVDYWDCEYPTSVLGLQSTKTR